MSKHDGIMAPEDVPQHPDEDVGRYFDFKRLLVEAGETLVADPAPEVTVDPEGPTIGEPQISGTKVLVQISGVEDDAAYVVTCAASTSAGNRRVLQGTLNGSAD